MAVNRVPEEFEKQERLNQSTVRQVEPDVVEALSRVLADTYTLYVKTQYYHWNVTGEQFYSLHHLFEKQYKSLANAIDKIAERLRALDAYAPGTLKEFQELSCLDDDRVLPESWQQMVQNLVADHAHLSNCSRAAMETAESVEDMVTHDMLIDRMNYHEKARWMLRSTLETQ